jgi:hypothetical protein
MTDVQNLWDEVNGRLTAIVVRYPDTERFIESFRKHVRFALHHPLEARHEKLLKKGKKWLLEVKWKHPLFRNDFDAILNAISKFEESRGQ